MFFLILNLQNHLKKELQLLEIKYFIVVKNNKFLNQYNNGIKILNMIKKTKKVFTKTFFELLKENILKSNKPIRLRKPNNNKLQKVKVIYLKLEKIQSMIY